MKKIVFTLFANGMIIGLLTSCMTAQTASWSNPEFAERKLGKTVVIAMADSTFGITQFESLLVNQLAASGVDAHSFHTLYPSADEMEDEQLTALVVSNKFDSILVTSVMSKDSQQQTIATGYTATPSMGYNGYGGYHGGYWGGYGMSYTLNPNMAQVSNSNTYEIETNLFDVQSEQPVWSGRNAVNDGELPMKNIERVVNSVFAELKAKNMF